MGHMVIRLALALSSAAAAVIHFAVTAEHFEEYVPFGVFFAALGAFQLIWAVVILLHPNRPVLALGVIVNALVVALWAVTRTTGIPIGPEAGEAEAVGSADLAATGLEALIVLGGLWLMTWRTESARQGLEEEDLRPQTA